MKATFLSSPIFLIIGILFITDLSFAQEPERKVPKNPEGDAPAIKPEDMPRVEKIGETRFRMGQIEFDAKTKEIFVPAVVNKREGGPIEYVLVHEKGKVHESILTSSASPLHLQIVSKLLKHNSGFGNVFDPMLAAQEQVGTDIENGDEFTLLVRWTADGKKQMEQDLSEWITDGDTLEGLEPAPWTFTGSSIFKGSFAAEIEGSFIAVYLDPVALLNMTRKGAHMDERWGANDKVIPETGQKVTVVLKPQS